MTRKSIAALLAVASFGITAPDALAQSSLSEAAAPTFFEYGASQEFRNNVGDRVGVLYGISNQPDVNVHQVSGSLGGRAFTGVAYFHTYDRATNHGTYMLSGKLDASGLNPAVPFLGQLDLQYDRIGMTYEFILTGTLLGQPVNLSTGRIVVR